MPDPVDMGGYTLQENAPLATRNTLRVAARARRLAEVHDAAALPALFASDVVREGPVLILGEGSNVLFTGDFGGTVVAMATRGVERLGDGDLPRLRVAAGERWDDFVRWSLGQGFAGLENLIMIPGTVGAAPMQNIGAYGVEVAEFIEQVEAFDRDSGQIVNFDREACRFAYRDSRFKHEPQRHVITTVTFALPRDRAPRIAYAGIAEQLQRMDVTVPTPFHIAEAVVQLRTRKLPDPAVIGNAGSFFKNPLVPAATVEALLREYPDLPHWPAAGGTRKVSAAWLIETSGFKGLREGDAAVSNRHALVLVNHGQASGAQLWALARHIMDGVEQRFGIRMEPEPLVI